jgi:hypothetical protein
MRETSEDGFSIALANRNTPNGASAASNAANSQREGNADGCIGHPSQLRDYEAARASVVGQYAATLTLVRTALVRTRSSRSSSTVNRVRRDKLISNKKSTPERPARHQ